MSGFYSNSDMIVALRELIGLDPREDRFLHKGMKPVAERVVKVPRNYSGACAQERIRLAKPVLAKHRTIESAAKELGCTANAIKQLFTRAGDRASKYLARP